MTSCMSTGCGWFTPSRVAGEIAYNIGTGTNFLIREKWNKLDFYIGDNNHTKGEDWYYAVLAYGPDGWSQESDPNNTTKFSPNRSPFNGTQNPGLYPYQEVIWGYAAHPPTVGQQLWSPQRIPWVPRGIFGTQWPGNWQPARETPRPTFYYLPDIKANYNGWNSYIVIQNTHNDLTLAVDIALYNQDGTFNKWWLDPPVPPATQPPPYIRLAPRASRTIAVADRFSGSSFNGSAVIAASQDVAVVVENQASSSSYAYNGITAGGYGDPTFERTGTTLYAPTMYGNQWGWDSTVGVMNTGSATANVQIQFKGRSGYGDTTRTYNISPNGQLEVVASSVMGSNWVGSLVIQSTNGQPLAAIVHEHHTSQATRAYNASSAGSSTLYVPAAYKNQWGMTTGLVVQNVGSGPTTAYLYFYDRDGNYIASVSLLDIDAGRAQGLWLGDTSAVPDGWTGWVKVGSSNGQPLAVYVNTVRPEGHYAYTGASTPGNTAILPWAAKNASGRTTGYTVLNTSSSSVQVTATYYDTSGWARASQVYSLPAKGVKGRYQGDDTFLPDPWQGSIVLQAGAGGPLMAMMREDSSSTTSAYNGVAR